VSRYDWMADAACAEVDPELFHPDGRAPSREARQICRRCPVQRACAAFAQQAEGEVTYPHRFGLWGGQLPKHRAKDAAGNGRLRRNAERRDHIIRLYRRGGMDAYQIAEAVGCDARTVWRTTKAYRDSLGEAA
jgi:WhiB family redox-sensing transcriptional regulator